MCQHQHIIFIIQVLMKSCFDSLNEKYIKMLENKMILIQKLPFNYFLP